jgi:hypothetical protein
LGLGRDGNGGEQRGAAYCRGDDEMTHETLQLVRRWQMTGEAFPRKF